MISYSKLREILANKKQLSSDGRAILESALLSHRPFAILPSNDSQGIKVVSTVMTAVPIPVPDFTAIIADPSDEQWKSLQRLLQNGYEVGLTMNVYPDAEYAKIPNGTRARSGRIRRAR